MEEFPGGRPEAKPNDNQDKKKKRRNNGVPLRFAALAELEKGRHDKPAPKEHLPLADLVLKSPEALKPDKPAAEKKADAGEVVTDKKPAPEQLPPEYEREVAEAEQPAEAKTRTEANEQAPTAEPEPETETHEAVSEFTLPKHELEPVEFSGGEVIIHLNGETPVAERVITLEPEVARAENAAAEADAAPAVFHRQPEQQHMGRDLPDKPESLPDPEPKPAYPVSGEILPDGFGATAGGGEVPPPPIGPIEGFAPPPPEDPYHHPAPEHATVTTPPSPELVATKQELEDARYYAAKAGQQRGLVTGLLVGGAYEHFKHKRREKKQSKRFNQQTKQLEQARKDYQFGQQETRKRQAETELRFNQITKQFENVPKAEKLTAPARPQIEQGEQLTVPEDHRLETSAWHTIEVDAKTGKAVENPAFQYGHEYYRERAQESGTHAQRDAAAGEIALVAAASTDNQQQDNGNNSAQQTTIPDASGQRAPSSLKEKTQAALRSTKKSNVTTGPLWPWIVALVVIFICLVLLLG